ncbi:hypothetical protein JTB14_004025 [Gonioctena quinquepunctata]|nr:hypothetical protein JTB14_004025 [Gonioctena quinquepunctata]
MKWAQQAPVRGRERAENIHTILPGLKGPARDNPPSESPLQAWRLIISDDILAEIVINTNKKIEVMKVDYSSFKTKHNSRYTFHPRFIQPTNKVEVEAFIGLLYLQGIFKSGHEDLESLWAADGTGVNSRVLYQFARHGEEISRYNYLKELGLALCYQHVHTRINNNFIPRKIRDRAADIFGIQFTYSQRAEDTQGNKKRKRCGLCPPKKYRKSSYVCRACEEPICLKCCCTVCPDCIK